MTRFVPGVLASLFLSASAIAQTPVIPNPGAIQLPDDGTQDVQHANSCADLGITHRDFAVAMTFKGEASKVYMINAAFMEKSRTTSDGTCYTEMLMHVGSFPSYHRDSACQYENWAIDARYSRDLAYKVTRAEPYEKSSRKHKENNGTVYYHCRFRYELELEPNNIQVPSFGR